MTATEMAQIINFFILCIPNLGGLWLAAGLEGTDSFKIISQFMLMFQDSVLFENWSLTNTKKETTQQVGRLVCIIDIMKILNNMSNKNKSKRRHIESKLFYKDTKGPCWMST